LGISKQFFFEKKNQENYIEPSGAQEGRKFKAPNKEQKFFGSFFQKGTASFLAFY
jgi:hypothetical protein